MGEKFHVNPETGEYGHCHATQRPCPLGGSTGKENHYDTRLQAIRAQEKILSEHYGIFAVQKQTQPKSLSDYRKSMIEAAEIKTFTVNGLTRVVNKILAANPILQKYDNPSLVKLGSSDKKGEFYKRFVFSYNMLAETAAGEGDLEAYAAYLKLSSIYEAAQSIWYSIDYAEKYSGKNMSNRKKELCTKRLKEAVAEPFPKSILSQHILSYQKKKKDQELLSKSQKVMLQDGREVRVQEAVIGYSDTGEKIVLTTQQRQQIQKNVRKNAKELLNYFHDENNNFAPPPRGETEVGGDFKFVGNGSEGIAYLHTPTMMVYKIPHSENPLFRGSNDKSKSSCAINKLSQQTIQKLDKKVLKDTGCKYLPTMFLNVPTGTKFGLMGISVQPYLDKSRFTGYLVEHGYRELVAIGLNDLHEGNVYLDAKTGIVFMNDCVTWGRDKEVNEILKTL